MNIADQFPIFKKKIHGNPLIYLDSAATNQKPAAVIDAITRFYAEDYGTVHRALYTLASEATAHYSAVRTQVQHFLGAASAQEIIFTKGTTEAINLVACSFASAFLKPGDEVIISAMEHHSNIVPWQFACQKSGATLKVIPMNDQGELLLEEYEKLLSPRTKIVSITHISNALGTENPIKKMIAMAHAVGAKVCIDGAQSASHIPLNVQDLDCDFFAFSGHKAFGPTGIGILYGKKELLEALPPYQGGGDMIETVTFSATTFQKPPLKFEAGTPMIAEVMGLGKAIDFIESLGRDKIAAWEKQLLTYATERLSQIDDLKLIGTASKKGPIISFTIEGIHPLDLGTLLDLKGIALRTGNLCAQPTLHHFNLTAVARVSFAAYNSFKDIDLFIDALQEVTCQLQH